MAIHNSQNKLALKQETGRARISSIVSNLLTNSRNESIKSRTSLPIIGKVTATQESRTGILTKTQKIDNKKMRDGSGSTRISLDKVNNHTAGTTPQTRRSGSFDRKIISRVSSRYTNMSRAGDNDED